MLKGKTKSGFAYEIEDEALNDWELLEGLVDIDNGQYSAAVPTLRLLLGDKQTKALKEHCRNEETGKVPQAEMFKEMAEILNGKGSEDGKEKNV